ncbi:MAG: enoyl-CoA hydratase [Rhizobiales bacterium]|nr:enoyl-CoA hydratase [Hyphomicrobiales bacterium]
MGEFVKTSLEQAGVGLIRFDRPEARNALNEVVRGELAAAFEQFGADDAVRCVVLAGTDKVFAAGADIKAMAEASAEDMANTGGEAAWQVIRRFAKPIVAAVNGWALGGGCELAMHADIIVAGEGAKFGQPEIRVGIIPGAGGTQRLTRAVGKFKAMQMLLTGEPVSAADASAMGLVSEVVADDQALARALEIASRIARLPPIAAREIKRLVLSGVDKPLDDGLIDERRTFVSMFDTEDQKEGMRAFIEKRRPDFKGK